LPDAVAPGSHLVLRHPARQKQVAASLARYLQLRLMMLKLAWIGTAPPWQSRTVWRLTRSVTVSSLTPPSSYPGARVTGWVMASLAVGELPWRGPPRQKWRWSGPAWCQSHSVRTCGS